MADDENNSFVQWRHAPSSAWRYCPLCAHALTDHAWDGKSRRFCLQCGFVYWERPLPAVAALIRDRQQNRLLVVRRRYPPEMGRWTFPGGGIEAGESITTAIIREAKEETGLTIALDYQLGTWSTPSSETLITFFVAHPDYGQVQAGSDALEAQWFSEGELPALGFSTHQDVLEMFKARRFK